MGHDGMASGYTTPIGFRRLMDCQWDSRDRGVTVLDQIKFSVHYHKQT